MKSKYSKEQLAPIIKRSLSWNMVCSALGITPGGSRQAFFKRLALHYKIDYSHFLGKSINKLTRTKAKDALKLNSGFSRMTVRKIVIEDKLLPYYCAVCRLEPSWRNKPLTLTLDHINGNCKDHRLNNLRFVCPNCNAQLDTTAGKNIGRW